VKVAAYQAPLLTAGSVQPTLDLIARQVSWCESAGVGILCCPEGVLGGLADYAPRPFEIAVDVDGGRLETLLAPLASDRVTTIVGFTETDRRGRLFNTAAVFCQGRVAGVYRKRHPAINRSVYEPGTQTPVFTVAGLTFGIVICRDSTFAEPARLMADQGAAAIFVPTNGGLPSSRKHTVIAADVRKDDIARATENRVTVIRADVTGRAGDLVSVGSSEIVGPDGVVVAHAQPFTTGLLVADVALGAEDR